jgi:hypothetical protein
VFDNRDSIPGLPGHSFLIYFKQIGRYRERERMKPILLSLVIFACIFGSAVIGIVLRRLLPEHHLGEESRNVVALLGIGIVGAMAALVLALLITGAQNSFLNKRSELMEMSAKIVFLDDILADYGPDTNEARALLRRSVIDTIDEYWPGYISKHAGLEQDIPGAQVLYNNIMSLVPRTDAQRSLRDEALATGFDLAQLHDLLRVQKTRSVPGAFLIAVGLLVFWFAAVFFSLGIYAPPNLTVVALLVLFALSVAIAFFMIIELNLPFEGILHMPSAPLTYVLDHIGK